MDDLTVDIKLKYPDPDLLHGLSARAVTINPADKVAADPDYFTHPISAGPYVVTEYTPNGPLKMKENPNYVNGPMVVKNIEIASVPGPDLQGPPARHRRARLRLGSPDRGEGQLPAGSPPVHHRGQWREHALPEHGPGRQGR